MITARRAAAIGVALAMLASCGNGEDEDLGDEGRDATSSLDSSPDTATTAAPTSTTSPAPTVAAAPSAGCGTANEAPTGAQALDWDGTERTYLLAVPASYEPGVPAPLLFDLHGLAEPASVQASYSQLPAKAGERGYVVVEPQGTGTPPMWVLPPFESVDDTGFITALLDHLEATLCIDTSRVFVDGISNGAGMAGGLSCVLADRIAAVAMVAGPNTYRPCTEQPAVPLVAFHGTEDSVVPYEGGALFEDFPDRLRLLRALQSVEVQSAPAAAAGWAERNGCEPTPSEEQVTDHVRRLAYGGCEDEVVLYVVEGAGHTWPGATAGLPTSIAGPTTTEISASDLLLDFFDANPL